MVDRDSRRRSPHSSPGTIDFFDKPIPERLPTGSISNMSLPRTLEPESMDTAQEAEEYELMDHSAVNEAFVCDLLAGGNVGPRVVDLGCGPAAIAILLAQRLPEIQVMGIDSAIEMLEVAKREIDFGGVMERVYLQHADAKTLEDFDDEMTDTVISNSLLHHLEDPQLALATAQRLLREGGRLFFRDLARPDTSESVESLVQRYAGEESEFAQQLLRQSLHAALTLSEIRDLAGGLGISPEQVQMTSDRHWTIDWQRP
jgi:ubiquinone/menaquinone biosynthesis C-methylase UbiE